MTPVLLSAQGLRKHFPVRGGGLVKAVDGIDFQAVGCRGEFEENGAFIGT